MYEFRTTSTFDTLPVVDQAFVEFFQFTKLLDGNFYYAYFDYNQGEHYANIFDPVSQTASLYSFPTTTNHKNFEIPTTTVELPLIAFKSAGVEIFALLQFEDTEHITTTTMHDIYDVLSINADDGEIITWTKVGNDAFTLGQHKYDFVDASISTENLSDVFPIHRYQQDIFVNKLQGLGYFLGYTDSNTSVGASADVYFSILGSDLGTVTGPTLAHTWRDGSQEFYSAGQLDEDHIYIIYKDSTDLYLQKISTDGSLVGERIFIDSDILVEGAYVVFDTTRSIKTDQGLMIAYQVTDGLVLNYLNDDLISETKKLIHYDNDIRNYSLNAIEHGFGLTIVDTRETVDTLTGLKSYNSNLYYTEGIINSLPMGDISIIGETFVGKTLSALPSLTDLDGIGPFNYQWLADGQMIDGANNQDLLLTQNEVGKAITVAVSYIDEQGTFEFITSDATNVIAPIPTSLFDTLQTSFNQLVADGGFEWDALHTAPDPYDIVDETNLNRAEFSEGVGFVINASQNTLTHDGVSYDPWSVNVGEESFDISYFSTIDNPQIEISGTRYDDVFYDEGLTESLLVASLGNDHYYGLSSPQSEIDFGTLLPGELNVYADPHTYTYDLPGGTGTITSGPLTVLKGGGYTTNHLTGSTDRASLFITKTGDEVLSQFRGDEIYAYAWPDDDAAIEVRGVDSADHIRIKHLSAATWQDDYSLEYQGTTAGMNYTDLAFTDFNGNREVVGLHGYADGDFVIDEYFVTDPVTKNGVEVVDVVFQFRETSNETGYSPLELRTLRNYGDEVEIGLFVDPENEEYLTGIQSLQATVGVDFDLSLLEETITAAGDLDSFMSVSVNEMDNEFTVSAAALNPVTDLTKPILTFNANILEGLQTAEFSIFDAELNSELVNPVFNEIDLVSSVVEIFITDRSGNVVDVNNIDVLSGENVFSAEKLAPGHFEFIIDRTEDTILSITPSDDDLISFINSADAREALRLAVGYELPSGETGPQVYLSADYNNNGRITASDALEILKAAVLFNDALQPYWHIAHIDETSSTNRWGVDLNLEGGTVELLAGDTTDTLNLTAIIVGDIDNSAVLIA